MLFLRQPSPWAAMIAMISGGGTTLSLILADIQLPYGLDENFFGIMVSVLLFIFVQYFHQRK
jgi:SSS family solute:Na+ symporter